MVIHSAQDIMQALQAVENPRIVITTHHKPDADAMGSSLGLKLFLQTFGYRVDVVSPTDYATFLNWMKDCDKVIIYDNEPELSKQLAMEADFIFCLDFNHLSRINEFGEVVTKSNAVKVLIDHHQFPQGFENLTFWDDLASSTCELVYRFIHVNNMDERIDKHIAECLYTGIVTDTGSFRFSNTSSETLKIAARLMEKEIDHVEIYNQVFDSFTESRVRFIGYAISQKLEVLPEYNTALITINKEELKKFNVITGDTEGLVNYGLSIEGIKFAALIIDRTKIVKMSFRSKSNFASNNFAMQHFNGGGHFYAAGGSSELSLEETVEKFKQTLKIYKAQLNEN
jgi:phosphoesterase RecJ-like protein